MNFRLLMAMMLPKSWVSEPHSARAELMAMAKRAKQGKKGKKGVKNGPATGGLWIAPRNSPKSATGGRGWENRPSDAPSNNRFLELADVALGLEQPILKKR